MENNNSSKLKIVNTDNTVNFGSYNEPVELNFEDYRTISFFNKLKSWQSSKKAIKKFNYYSFISNEYVIAVGFVKLNFVSNFFAYIHKVNHGTIYQDTIDIWNQRKVKYVGDNYNFEISWNTKKSHILLKKSDDGKLNIDLCFKNKLRLQTSINIPSDYERLIVCNPADFSKWTFTEKMYCLKPEFIEAKLDNQLLFNNNSNVMISSDWSAGFFKKETNWLWSAGNGQIDEKTKIGFNFTVFVNDAFYPENCIWINNKKHIIPRVLFDIHTLEEEKNPIRVYTLDKSIDLTFKICGLKEDIANRMGIVITNFRQFVGKYTGTIKLNNKTFEIKELIGFFEIHKSIW